MSVELSYRVVHLSQAGPFLRMVLEELKTVPPEEIERARLAAEQEPGTDAVDAGKQFGKIDPIPAPKTQMEEVFSAMRTQFPELMEVFKLSPPPRRGAGRVLMAVPLPSSQTIEMYITHEQYAELGSPPLLSTLKLSLELEPCITPAEK